MSVGGVFQLISNDGIQDKLIMATDMLRARMKKIGAKRLVDMREEFPNESDQELLLRDKAIYLQEKGSPMSQKRSGQIIC